MANDGTGSMSIDDIAASMIVSPAGSSDAASSGSAAPRRPSTSARGSEEGSAVTPTRRPARQPSRNSDVTADDFSDSDLEAADDQSDDADDQLEEEALGDGQDDRQDDTVGDASSEQDVEVDGETTDDAEEDILSDIFATDTELADESAAANGVDPKLLTDDLPIIVKIDGEDVAVPLGDLKRRHAGEGAIENRLAAATEARKQAVEDYEKSRQLTEAFLSEFGQVMFRRVIPEPSAELRESDPQQYLQHKEAFDAEGAQLAQMQQKLAQMVGGLEQQQKETIAGYRTQMNQELRRIMPVFKDPVRGPKVKAAIVEAAREIGYTDQQIKDCVDPLMFKTVALAARELRRQKAAKIGKSKEKARTMASKGSRNRSVTTSRRDRRQEAAMKRARETGKPDDVAATMIVSPSGGRRRPT